MIWHLQGMANHANQSRSIHRKRQALAEAEAGPMEVPKGVRLLAKEKRLFTEWGDCIPASLRNEAVAHILARAVKLQTQLTVYEDACRKEPFVTAQSGVYRGHPIPNPANQARLATANGLAVALRQCGLTLHAASALQARNNSHQRDVEQAKKAAPKRAGYAHLIGGKQPSAMN